MNRAGACQAVGDLAKLWDWEYLAALEKWISDMANRHVWRPLEIV